MIEDERYSRSLYIPLKTSMPFAEILKYKNWVHMLLSATDVSSKVLQALGQILGFIVEITKNMVAIEPLISKEILKDAVFEKRRFQSTSNFIRFYGFLENIVEDNNVDLDADVKDDPDCLEKKWKQ